MIRFHGFRSAIVVAVSGCALAGVSATAAEAKGDVGRAPRVLDRFSSFDGDRRLISDGRQYVAWHASATGLVVLDASDGARRTFEVPEGYRLVAVGAGTAVWEQNGTFMTGDLATGSITGPVTRTGDVCGDAFGSDGGIREVSATSVVARCDIAKAGQVAYAYDRTTGQRAASPLPDVEVCAAIKAVPPYAPSGSESEDGSEYQATYERPLALIAYSGRDRRIPRLAVRSCDGKPRVVLQRTGGVALTRLSGNYAAWSSSPSPRSRTRVHLYSVSKRKSLVQRSFARGSVSSLQLVGSTVFVRTEAGGRSTILSLRPR